MKNEIPNKVNTKVKLLLEEGYGEELNAAILDAFPELFADERKTQLLHLTRQINSANNVLESPKVFDSNLNPLPPVDQQEWKINMAIDILS